MGGVLGGEGGVVDGPEEDGFVRLSLVLVGFKYDSLTILQHMLSARPLRPKIVEWAVLELYLVKQPKWPLFIVSGAQFEVAIEPTRFDGHLGGIS